MENILYLGGPNIASEIYNKEYANARICGAEKWRKPLGKFLRQSHFIVWDNGDLITHEVMGGLKNVYAIGAGKMLFCFCKLSFCLMKCRTSIFLVYFLTICMIQAIEFVVEEPIMVKAKACLGFIL